ncbi:MAG: glutaredoxin family protein [Anaerolineae bacterium]|nr:glutaredoxin family protein [Anaerolineae bacterium]
MNARGSVSGPRAEHCVIFYGLSTCIWCKRTRQFLEDQGVQFDYVYVDLLEGREREEVLAQVRRWNPAVSFPVVVVNSSQCVVGYDREALKRVLGL